MDVSYEELTQAIESQQIDMSKEKAPTIYRDRDSISFQFWGWAIVFLKKGGWYLDDTSGC